MRIPDTSRPQVVAAIGAGIAMTIAALCWGIAQMVPPICEGAAVVIKAFAAGGGIAVAAATTGLATAGRASAWLAPAASAGLAATGAAVSYIVIHKIVEKAKDEPYEWLLPALALLAVFFVDLSKEALFTSGTARAIYALITGCCTIGGGVLLLNNRFWVRAAGFLVPFLPTIVVWAALVREGQVANGLADFVSAGSGGAIGLIGALFMGALVAVLGVVLPRQQRAA